MTRGWKTGDFCSDHPDTPAGLWRNAAPGSLLRPQCPSLTGTPTPTPIHTPPRMVQAAGPRSISPGRSHASRGRGRRRRPRPRRQRGAGSALLTRGTSEPPPRGRGSPRAEGRRRGSDAITLADGTTVIFLKL